MIRPLGKRLSLRNTPGRWVNGDSAERSRRTRLRRFLSPMQMLLAMRIIVGRLRYSRMNRGSIMRCEIDSFSNESLPAISMSGNERDIAFRLYGMIRVSLTKPSFLPWLIISRSRFISFRIYF